MNWFQAIMRVCSTKLIKMVVGPKALAQKPFSPEEVKKQLDEFFLVIVPELNRGLSQHDYFCGDEITAADIIIYNELKTVLTLHRRELVSRETPDLYAWYNGRLALMSEVKEVDTQFVEIVKKY